MYAQVAPLRSLPKQFSICDYSVPLELQNKLTPGQMVIIPFRKSKLFGLVLSLSLESPFAKKVKPIERLVHEIPVFRKEEIQFFLQLSNIYHDALGPLLESSLPPLQKRKLENIQLDTLPLLSSKIKKPELRQYVEEKEHFEILNSFSAPQTLILVPEIRSVEKVRQHLKNKHIALWHSEMTTKQKFDTWFQIRNGKSEVIIGTRSAVFLTFFHLKNIVVVDEENKDHKQEEGMPRFHVKDVAKQLAFFHGAQLTYTSSHPSSETYYFLYQHEYEIPGKTIESAKTVNVVRIPQKESPIFIDLKSEQIGHKSDYFLSTRVQEEIEMCTQDVFLFLNRRGSATSIYCQSCGYKENCEICKNARVYHESDKQLHCHFCNTKKPVPLRCPKCQTDLLQLKGYGTEQIEKTVKKIIESRRTPHQSTSIIRLDSDIEEKLRGEILKTTGQKVIIGTELSFHYLDWSKIGLVVCVNVDQNLTLPEFNSEERLWHLIEYIQYARSDQSLFYIQTHSPEHTFWKTLSNPDLFYRNDLKKRKAFHFPPYSYMVKYLCLSTDEKKGWDKACDIKRNIAEILTKTTENSIIYDPIELHPHFYRKQYWYGIIVLLPHKNAFHILEYINKTLGPEVKVDLNPNSILSP